MILTWSMNLALAAAGLCVASGGKLQPDHYRDSSSNSSLGHRPPALLFTVWLQLSFLNNISLFHMHKHIKNAVLLSTTPSHSQNKPPPLLIPHPPSSSSPFPVAPPLFLVGPSKRPAAAAERHKEESSRVAERENQNREGEWASQGLSAFWWSCWRVGVGLLTDKGECAGTPTLCPAQLISCHTVLLHNIKPHGIIYWPPVQIQWAIQNCDIPLSYFAGVHQSAEIKPDVTCGCKQSRSGFLCHSSMFSLSIIPLWLCSHLPQSH